MAIGVARAGAPTINRDFVEETLMHRTSQRTGLATLIVFAMCGTAPAWAASPLIKLKPGYDHPSANTQVTGSGFGASEAVDVYFDTTDEAIVVTNASGGFGIKVPVPANATPGAHYITAVGRRDGLAAQKLFSVSTDWAQFHFDQQRKGLNPYENVLAPGNVADLDLDWTFPTGNVVGSTPAVVRGILYVGSSDDNIYAINATTGAQLWKYQTGGPVYSSPAVANGVVYAGSGDDNLYAINATTGALVWSVQTLAPIFSSPAVANGVVYVGSTDDNFYAYNASTGALLWAAHTGGQIVGDPAVANGVVYIGSGDGNLYAFNATTGAQLWAATTVEPVYDPVVANGIVYVGLEEFGLYAFNATTGAFVWAGSANGGVFGTAPAVANGVVYAGNSNGLLYAFNAGNGFQLWASGVGPVGSAPAVANGVVYASAFGTLYALDRTSGATLWSAVVATTVNSSPTVTNGMIYIGSDDNSVHAYALYGGNDPLYRGNRQAPAIWSLHPDWSLKPSRSEDATP
jgi:outer membrane protein assembly factor BamB